MRTDSELEPSGLQDCGGSRRDYAVTDRITPEQRSKNMSRIRAKDTRPEWVVRRLLHGLGFRYRLHGSKLPGKPDLVFSSRRAVIFVHGCYWHGHGCSRGGTGAKTNSEYWKPKIAGNKSRDQKHLENLTALGWRVHEVWECEVKDGGALSNRLVTFLNCSD
jgi:DNA mismatch endonuclease (patch repair protein)